jgi:hypothetical protein
MQTRLAAADSGTSGSTTVSVTLQVTDTIGAHALVSTPITLSLPPASDAINFVAAQTQTLATLLSSEATPLSFTSEGTSSVVLTLTGSAAVLSSSPSSENATVQVQSLCKKQILSPHSFIYTFILPFT